MEHFCSNESVLSHVLSCGGPGVMNTLLRVSKEIANAVTKVTDDYFWKSRIESLYEVAPIPLEVTKHYDVDWKGVYRRMLKLKREVDSHLSCEVFVTGNVDDVRVALWMGIDPSTSDNCAIGLASMKGHIEIVKLLLEDERVDPSADDNSAVERASENGHAEIVRLLLADKRVDPSAGDNYAIQWASSKGHIEIVRVLLTDKRVDPSDDNNHAVMWASENGHIEVIKLLLADERVSSTYKVL